MCKTSEWREFNKDRSRSVRDKISNLILTDRFWKKAREVQKIIDSLFRVLKIVNQDKKPILSIIYEAMDRAKLAIKTSNNIRISIRMSLIKEGQLHRYLHVAGNLFIYL